VCILLASTPPLTAQQVPQWRSWDAPELALAGTFATALWIDAAQTRAFRATGVGETNPLLGPHPSDAQVNRYTVAAWLMVLSASAALPHRWRRLLLVSAATVEVIAVTHNTSLGFPVQF